MKKLTLLLLIAFSALMVGCQNQGGHPASLTSGTNSTSKQQAQSSPHSTTSQEATKSARHNTYPMLFSDDFPGDIPKTSTTYTLVIDTTSFGKQSPWQGQDMNHVVLTSKEVNTQKPMHSQRGILTKHLLTFKGLQSVSYNHLQYYNLPGVKQIVLYTNVSLTTNHQVFMAVADGMGGVFVLKDKNGRIYETHSEDRNSYWAINTDKWYTLLLKCDACHTKDTTYFKFKIRSNN